MTNAADGNRHLRMGGQNGVLQWYGCTWRPRPTDLKIGWESYGGAADTLWFDDVALGASRIGC
ncbi:hypothetical protein ACIBOV_32295 [Micromonospora chersina]|uniref:hypothetical protein n=1 Tax=Micromonospora chersina TaxID=47854 RepID=UPI00379DCF5E